MTLAQLRIFVAVARRLNYTRAADDLYLSQPHVSGQVHALEREFGVPLFIQTGKRIRLTDAGLALLARAERLLALAEETGAMLREHRAVLSGRLTVAASTTIGTYILPSVLGRFQRRYPGVGVAMTVANSQAVSAAVLAGEADLGLVEGEGPTPGLEGETFAEDELVVIAAPDSPLAARERLEPTDLTGAPFLPRESGSGTREVVESALARAGVRVMVAMELGSTEAIKRAVAADLGISVVSRTAVELELLAGRLVVLPVQGWDLRRQFALLWPVGSRLSPAAAALRTLLRGGAERTP